MNRWISGTGWKWGQRLFDADKLVITAQGLPHLLTFTALPRQVTDVNLFETHICVVNAHREHGVLEDFLDFKAIWFDLKQHILFMIETQGRLEGFC